jgi:hypothetical protein
MQIIRGKSGRSIDRHGAVPPDGGAIVDRRVAPLLDTSGDLWAGRALQSTDGGVNAWNEVVNHRSWRIGCNSANEHFFDPDYFEKALRGRFS